MHATTSEASTPQRLFVVLAATSLVLVGFLANPAQARQPDHLFLQGDGVPTASATPHPPPAAPLPNFDAHRNDHPGLTIQRTDKGFAEMKADNHQLWLLPSGMTSLKKLKLTVWSALKEFEDGPGVLNGYLADCDANGSDCRLIASTQVSDPQWSGLAEWTKRKIQFDDLTTTIGADRRFGVKLVVANESDDEMWFAYGVADFPAFLEVFEASGSTTTTTTSTTTTSTTTTTTVPEITTTTTTTLPQTTTSTTTTTLPGDTTTTTTSVPNDTTTTTTTTVPGPTTTTVPGAATIPKPPISGATATTIPSALTPVPTVVSQAAEEAEAEAESGDDDDEGAIVAANDGGDTGNGDALLAALAVPPTEASDTPPPPATMAAPISGRFIEGSSGVLPPAVAEVLFSPLMIFELLLRALTEAGRAILLPALLLALVTAGAITRGWGAKPVAPSA